MMTGLRSEYQRQAEEKRAKEVLLGSLKVQRDPEVCEALLLAARIIAGLESSACEMDAHRRTLAACAEVMKARFKENPDRETAASLAALEIIMMDDEEREKPENLLRVILSHEKLLQAVLLNEIAEAKKQEPEPACV